MYHRFYNAKTHFAHTMYPSVSRDSHDSEYCPEHQQTIRLCNGYCVSGEVGTELLNAVCMNFKLSG
jgi:nitrite reductase/ring-hydroxylating ferredoxin subunit